MENKFYVVSFEGNRMEEYDGFFSVDLYFVDEEAAKAKFLELYKEIEGKNEENIRWLVLCNAAVTDGQIVPNYEDRIMSYTIFNSRWRKEGF